MYYFNSDFLFESDQFTTLEIVESDVNTIIQDHNNRKLIVKAIPGRNSVLSSYPGFTVLYESDMSFGLYKLRSDNFIIKGVRFYFNNLTSRFSQQITISYDSVINGNDMLAILFRSDALPATVNDYVDILNESHLCYCVIENATDWDLVNYYDLDVYSNRGRDSDSKIVTDFNSIFIDSPDIISAYMDAMQQFLPDITITSELSDITPRDTKTSGYLVMKAMLPNYQGELVSGSIIPHEEFNKYMMTEIRIDCEYLSDDLIRFTRFRNEFMFQKGPFEDVVFSLVDSEGFDWKCVANYDYQMPEELDMTPQSKIFDAAKLYSFKYSVKLIGYMVYNYVRCPEIQSIIINLKTESGITIYTREIPLQTNI